jgi:hypothetical protein
MITLLVDYGMQKVEEQHQQLLHHIYEATRVKETVKSATTSSSSFNPNPPPSKPMQVIFRFLISFPDKFYVIS